MDSTRSRKENQSDSKQMWLKTVKQLVQSHSSYLTPSYENIIFLSLILLQPVRNSHAFNLVNIKCKLRGHWRVQCKPFLLEG